MIKSAQPSHLIEVVQFKYVSTSLGRTTDEFRSVDLEGTWKRENFELPEMEIVCILRVILPLPLSSILSQIGRASCRERVFRRV